MCIMHEPTHRVDVANGVLRVSIELPLLTSTKGVTLDLGATSLSLREAAVGYELDLTLPHAVDEADAAAQFDKPSRVLAVSLPLKLSGPDLHACVRAGRPLAEHAALLAELGITPPPPDLAHAHFDDCTFVNVKSAGVSLAFDGPAPAERRLGCIHLFAGGADGYGRCSLALPCGLRFTMVGKDVVDALGEPDKKSGGGKTPLLLVYHRRGVQVSLAATSWDRGKTSPVEAVDVFAPAPATT